MAATDVKPSRLAAVQKAVRIFLDKLPKGYRVAMVSFADAASVVLPPTANREAAKRAVNGLRPGDGTAVGEGISAPYRLRAAYATRAARRFRQRSSSSPTARRPRARSSRCRRRDEPNGRRFPSTPCCWTPDGVVQVRGDDGFMQQVTVPPDPATMRKIAATTGARFYAAPDGARLDAVYDELGSRVGRVRRDREVTAAFAAGGALLLLAAGAASAMLFGRLP